jgi:nucleoside-diphosphate-sugar epimerase
MMGKDRSAGDGSAMRSHTYNSDMVKGIFTLMQSDLEGPVNNGCPQYVTVDELVETVIEVSGKKINVKHIDGSVGVQSRNFSNARIYSLGWCPGLTQDRVLRTRIRGSRHRLKRLNGSSTRWLRIDITDSLRRKKRKSKELH